MKKMYVLAIALCVCLNVFSQATSLTIDNQTPGWLSSKIEYGDQLTLESLTVTGYLNSVDLKFIGGMINKTLKSIDLTNVIYTSGNNLPEKMFGNSNYELTKLALPLSIEVGNDYCLANVFCDTLIVGSESCHVITEKFPSTGSNNAKHWILREGVDSIMHRGLRMSEHYNESAYLEDIIAHSVAFPSTLKYIGSYALERCKNITRIELPESVEEIGEGAFQGTSWNPDTIKLPKSLKKYHMLSTSFQAHLDVGNTVVFYFSKNIQYIDNTRQVYWTNLHQWGNEDLTINRPIEIHIEKQIPPEIKYGTENTFNNATIYVPKGASERYRKTVPWNKATIIEEIFVEGITIDKNKNLYVGDEIAIVAHIIPEDATDQTMQWESSNPEVATISDNGYLKALTRGTTIVTVTTKEGGFKATCKVNVYEHTTGVEMIDKITIPIDKTYTLNAQTLPLTTSDGKVTYTSDNSTIASVNDKGIVVANKKGTCTITATTVDGGYTATCKVTVTQPVEALTLEKHEMSLKVGETERLYTQIVPANADDKNIAWSSSDEQIATVDAKGNVTGQKAGETWIKAVSQDNEEVNDSCIVTVIQPVTGIQLESETYTLVGIGDSFELKAKVIPDDASNKNIKWTSSNESVCVVSRGKVISVGYGFSVIVANTEDGGYIATCTVNVYEKEDVNRDFKVDVADVASIIDFMSGKSDMVIEQADVNSDGTVDVADIATIIDKMAGRARLLNETKE